MLSPDTNRYGSRAFSRGGKLKARAPAMAILAHAEGLSMGNRCLLLVSTLSQKCHPEPEVGRYGLSFTMLLAEFSTMDCMHPQDVHRVGMLSSCVQARSGAELKDTITLRLL
jgi:hypothetical protein